MIHQIVFWSRSAQLSVSSPGLSRVRLSVNGTVGTVDVSCPGGMTTTMENGEVPQIQHISLSKGSHSILNYSKLSNQVIIKPASNVELQMEGDLSG